MVAEIFRSITEARPSKKKKKQHEKAYLKNVVEFTATKII